jgi:BirA family biotin operon repressor/biotin-[acetyl-CoA-carboxylase] ligase
LYGSNVNPDRFQAVTDLCERLGWPPPLLVESTASTNDDLVGRPGHGQVLVAQEQTAGKGRMGRSWVSRPGDGLTFSVRLDVPTTVTAWGWIPLLSGLAVADSVESAGARDIAVKWPNDVVAGSGKLAGVLSQRDGDSAVVGIGINLGFAGPRPDPLAVSVSEQGGAPDGDHILAGVVSALDRWFGRFVDAGGDPYRSGLHDEYCRRCVTLGREVRVGAPDGVWEGRAESLDADGHLIVVTADGPRAVTAADVTLMG